MVGCMVATSLAMAPAMLLTEQPRSSIWTDRCWLAADRSPALRYADGRVYPPPPELWG